MTVPAKPSVAVFVEDGATLVFPFAFPFRDRGDIQVHRRMAGGDWVAVVPSAVSGGGEGGTVTLTATVAGARLRIRRRTARTQGVSYTTRGDFPAASHEGALDRLTLIAQEQDDALDEMGGRAVLVPAGAIPLRLPDPTTLAGKALFVLPDGRIVGAAIGDGRDPGLRDDLSAGQGLELVRFVQTGAGAIPRTGQGKSREIVSVRDYGARGDGVSDDSAAFRAAFAAVADDGTIVVPAGDYLVASTIAVTNRAGLALAGAGARIRGGPLRFRSFLRLTNCRRMRITGLTFDQRKATMPAYTAADYAGGILNCAIELDGSARVAVSHCAFDDLYTSAIFARNSSDVAVTDSLFTSGVQVQDQWIQHIHFQTCSGVLVRDCRFENAAIADPATGVCSIYASGIARYAIIEQNFMEYAGRDNRGTHRLGAIDFYGDAQTVRIIDNVSRFGMAQFARVNAVRGGLVAGNRVHASPRAELDYSMLSIEGTVFFAPGQIGTADTTVRDNLFEDPGQRHAFAVGAIAYDWGVPILNVKVLDNVFDGCRRSVLIRGPNYGCVVRGNNMRGAAGSVLVDQQTAITADYGNEAGSIFRNLTIADNDILDESGGGSSAIVVSTAKDVPYSGAVDHITVAGNRVRSRVPNAGQGVVVNLAADTPKGHSRIQDNEIVNYAIGLYARSAQVATLAGNRMLSCATPISIEAGVRTVERHGNRYTDSPMSGQVALVAGTATVSTPEVRADDLGRIRVWMATVGGAPGFLSAGGINDAQSFIINSTSVTDTSTVRWQIDR